MRYRKMIYMVTVMCFVLAACSPVSPAGDEVEAEQPQPTAPYPEQPSDREGRESGVQGQVWIGPMCPVAQSGENCPDQPYPARITVLSAEANRLTILETDAEGRFQILLEPGTYVLQPESLDKPAADETSKGPGLAASEQYPYAEPVTVTVVEGQFTEVMITFDSGVR